MIGAARAPILVRDMARRVRHYIGRAAGVPHATAVPPAAANLLEDEVYEPSSNVTFDPHSDVNFAHFTSSSVDSINLAATDHGRIPIPRSIREALNNPVYGPLWQAACNLEVKNKICINKAWDEIETLPPGRGMQTGKWVFKIAYNPDGSLLELKPRWVACGYGQILGLDYNETHASTLPIASSSPLLLARIGTLRR